MTSFSDRGRNDLLAPHRQNRLCGWKSAWEVIEQSVDFAGDRNPPAEGKFKEPVIRYKQNLMLPVIYIAIDISNPVNKANKVILIWISSDKNIFYNDMVEILIEIRFLTCKQVKNRFLKIPHLRLSVIATIDRTNKIVINSTKGNAKLGQIIEIVE